MPNDDDDDISRIGSHDDDGRVLVFVLFVNDMTWRERMKTRKRGIQERVSTGNTTQFKMLSEIQKV